ncbi:caspase family protein [Streptomyces sp. NPDC051976]|uniref:HD domain-containing protein n=1 Tax=Streptomyces sp. NPDC051976 TaxID=3154947 RepID=UPI00343B1F6A
MTHKALLIGASTYDDPAISNLPFIPDDLRLVQSALTQREFGSVEILESSRGTTRTAVNARVSRFLRDANRSDVLFILLSGHGQHFEGADYLIPEDADFAIEPFADCCVEIGWRKELEDSAAARVLFLVDACREGLEQDSKSATGVRSWGKPKVAATLRRKVAYVYACSPAEKAHYVRPTDTAKDEAAPPGDSFSLFSRAVLHLISEVPYAVDLVDFEEQVQTRVAALHAAYGKPGRPQRVRVTTDADRRSFAVLPGPAMQAAAHPWVRSVANHPAWERTPAGLTREVLKELCAYLAGQLATEFTRSSDALRGDPWHDPEFAGRAQERMDFLVRQVKDRREGTIALSPTEAALIVLLPLVGHTYWTHEAARRVHVLADGTPTPERDRFHNFVRTHPRLIRRLRTLDQSGDPRGDAVRIRWWLFHRWLLQEPEPYSGQSLKSLLGPPRSRPGGPDRPGWVDTALSAERFDRFVQEQRAAPFSVPGDSALALPEVIAASTGHEHEVRHTLVASLAKAAHALAVDPVDLPEIVVEHLGISDAVDPAELLTTLRASDWRTSGLGRSLNALCQHPAVQIALRDHAQHTDELLRAINRHPALGPLRSLPPFADADLVQLSGNTPKHLSEGIRFNLAEDRVQELLMGESLYGEPKLAIRELYQNALDALRYRDARAEFLRRTGKGSQSDADWTGLINFRQAVDTEGDPYLECRDNGIGMGAHELSSAFAQGGTRFVDLTEYIEEQADWSALDPPLEVYPNSRFGIGVLSYFMLADEIEVRTCRMGRDGRPGRLLKVSIAGPGNLFRIEDLGEGEEPGTSVRLRLARGKKPVSCVDTLDELLWVAPYRTVAEHGSRRTEWEPGVLVRAQLERWWAEMKHRRGPSGVCVPSSDPDVWWIDGRGVLLADGFHVEGEKHGWITRSLRPPHGIVVNLHGRPQVELSVDRKTARGFDHSHVTRSALAAAPELIRRAPSLMASDWLRQVGFTALPIADRLVDHAIAEAVPTEVAGLQTSFDAVGSFEPDFLLMPLLTGKSDGNVKVANAAAFVRTIPSPLLRWRLITLYRASLGDHFSGPQSDDLSLDARPSDLALVTTAFGAVTYGPDWHSDLTLWLQGASKGSFRWDTSQSQLTHTGLPSFMHIPRWRSISEVITADEVFKGVKACGRLAGHVAERLGRLGYQVERLGDAAQVGPDDLPLLAPLGAPHGWLTPGAELTPAQIVFSAAQAKYSTENAARRLCCLGFQVPSEYPRKDHWPSEERTMLGSLWQDHLHTVSPEEARSITRRQLTSVAHRTNRPVHHVARLLRAWGFDLTSRFRLGLVRMLAGYAKVPS